MVRRALARVHKPVPLGLAVSVSPKQGAPRGRPRPLGPLARLLIPRKHIAPPLRLAAATAPAPR